MLCLRKGKQKPDIEAYSYARMRETDEKTEQMMVVQKRNIEIAKKMILAGSNDDFITQMTDLLLEQIHVLRKG